MVGFEGGQMPLERRIPKRGFTNIFSKKYEIVNVGTLNDNFDADGQVSIKNLKDKKIIKSRLAVKILGNGELKKALKIQANAFSKAAIEKIKSAGGKAEKI
jgi:large subunit ribosomal protein L15